MKKILVLGNGFIGNPIARYLRADISPKRLHELTSSDLKGYEVVINTAAKTNIDWCEKNRGARTEIAALVAGAMPQPRVSEYLSADPKRRIHPSLGAGLLVLRAFEKVKKNWNGKGKS